MSDLKQRREYLFICINDALVEHGIWSNESDIGILPDGRFDCAMAALFEAFAEGDIPSDLRTVAPMIDTLAIEYSRYQTNMAAAQKFSTPPPHSLAVVMQKLSELHTNEIMPEKPPLETIAELDRQRVGDAQIANMYGWILPNGAADIGRVQRQRREDPNALFENPINIAQRQKREAEERRIKAALRRQQNREEVATRVAPESIEDLIQQGVAGQQICDMKRISAQELEVYCVKNKLAMPSWSKSIEAAAAAQADVDAKLRREFLDGHTHPPAPIEGELVDPDELPDDDDMLSTDEKIVREAEKDPKLTPEDLAEFFGASVEYVTNVLSRRSEVVG